MAVTATMMSLLLFLAIRMPVGFALGAAGAIGLYMVGGVPIMLSILGTTPLTTPNNYALMTIPMFLLMAQFVIVSGYADNLFYAFTAWVGNVRGGLGIATVGTGAGLGGISGSSVSRPPTLRASARRAMVDT